MSNCTSLQGKCTFTHHFNSWVPLQLGWRESRALFQRFTKDKSLTKNPSCYSNLALNWQLKFADCAAPCNNNDVNYTKKVKQSRVQFVTSPIALLQLVLALARSAKPPKLAKSTLPPGLCLPYSTVAIAKCSCPSPSTIQVAPTVWSFFYF